ASRAAYPGWRRTASSLVNTRRVAFRPRFEALADLLNWSDERLGMRRRTEYPRGRGGRSLRTRARGGVGTRPRAGSVVACLEAMTANVARVRAPPDRVRDRPERKSKGGFGVGPTKKKGARASLWP